MPESHTRPSPRHRRPRERRQLRRAAAVGTVLAALIGAHLLAAPAAPAARAPMAARALNYALAHTGAPYRWGATGPSGFDCSGLTLAAYRAAGARLPRVSRSQARDGAPVRGRAHWRPGDLVFWSSNGAPSGVYHVGIWMGSGRVLHSPRPGSSVHIGRLFSPGHVLSTARRPGGHRAAPAWQVRPGDTGPRVRVVKRLLRANGHRDVSVRHARYGAAARRAVARVRARAGQAPRPTMTRKAWNRLVRGATR